jgi:hypothetical protein
VRAAWEKGKIERAIGYTRTSFWPLRLFTDLADINSQARQWLNEVANRRRHRETGQFPAERFQLEALRSLPTITPDYRDTVEALVHKDLRLSFDGNRYCVPPRYVGRHLTIKADAASLTIYDQQQEIVSYPRWATRAFPTGGISSTTPPSAIVDRLVENSEIFLLGGESLRKANKGPTPTA